MVGDLAVAIVYVRGGRDLLTRFCSRSAAGCHHTRRCQADLGLSWQGVFHLELGGLRGRTLKTSGTWAQDAEN